MVASSTIKATYLTSAMLFKWAAVWRLIPSRKQMYLAWPSIMAHTISVLILEKIQALQFIKYTMFFSIDLRRALDIEHPNSQISFLVYMDSHCIICFRRYIFASICPQLKRFFFMIKQYCIFFNYPLNDGKYNVITIITHFSKFCYCYIHTPGLEGRGIWL